MPASILTRNYTSLQNLCEYFLFASFRIEENCGNEFFIPSPIVIIELRTMNSFSIPLKML